jgi:hypothetical protein
MHTVKNLAASIAFASLSGISMAGVEFTAIGNDIAGPLHIANDGTVLLSQTIKSSSFFNSTNAYKWNKNTGYELLGSGSTWAKGAISHDGQYALLGRPSFAGGTYKYHTPEGVLEVGGVNVAGQAIRFMSANGKVLAAAELAEGYVNLWVNGVMQGRLNYPANTNMMNISESGDRILLSKGYTDSNGQRNIRASFLGRDGVITDIPVDFRGLPSMSDDGHSVTSWIDHAECASGMSVIYNETTGGLTEIGCKEDTMTPWQISPDGSIVTGYRGGNSNYPEDAYIWDQANGVRDLKEILLQNGYNVYGWTNLIVTDISADGSKLVGTGLNEAGEKRGFIMEVVQECKTGF